MPPGAPTSTTESALPTGAPTFGQIALPASATTICAFLATEADAGLAAATLSRRLAAIRVVHQGNQQTSAHDAPAVSEVMRGIRNRQKGRSSPKKAPLIDTDLTLLVETLDTTTLAGSRDRALLLIGFAAALRRSELVSIDIEHLAFRPEGLTLTIPFSKTDLAGDGIDMAVPAIPLSRYCPVAALKQDSLTGRCSGGCDTALSPPPPGIVRMSLRSPHNRGTIAAPLIGHRAKICGHRDAFR